MTCLWPYRSGHKTWPGRPGEALQEEVARIGCKKRLEFGLPPIPKFIGSISPPSIAHQTKLTLAYSRMKLSARAYYRVIKVAASIADLDQSPRIEEEHVAEALSYRQRILE